MCIHQKFSNCDENINHEAEDGMDLFDHTAIPCRGRAHRSRECCIPLPVTFAKFLGLLTISLLALLLNSNAQASTGDAGKGQLIWNGSPSPYSPYTTWNCQGCHNSNGNPEGNRFNAANASNVIAHAIAQRYGGRGGMVSLGPVNGGGITTAELNDVAAYIATFVPPTMNPGTVTYNTAKVFTIPKIALNTGPNPPTVTTFTGIATITAPTKGTVSYSGLTATYTPTTCQYGADSFTYVGRGPAGDSNTRAVTLTIGNPPTPVVSSSGTASSQTGVAFSYTITASNCPTSYSVGT